MSIHGKYSLEIKFLAAILLIFFVAEIFISAHTPIYGPVPLIPNNPGGPSLNAPPPPPQPYGAPGDNVKPNTGPAGPKTPTGNKGPNTRRPSKTTSGPATGRQTGRPKQTAGAFTRKAKAAPTSVASWEYWWARNRYHYLDLSSGLKSSEMYPSTPQLHKSAGLDHLKLRSFDVIRPMLVSNSARLKRAAIKGLARMDDKSSLPEIRNAITDGNQTVRDTALFSLGLISCPAAKHPLFHVAKNSKSAKILMKNSFIPDYFQAYALISLALSVSNGSVSKGGNSSGIESLLKSIALDRNAKPCIKAVALESLGLIGGSDITKFLIDFIENEKKPPNELAASAITAIGKAGDPVALPYLEKYLSSGKPHLVQSAALAIGKLANPADIRQVKSLYRIFRQINDQAAKGFCLVAMGMIGGPTAIDYLDHLVIRGKTSECGWACLSLGLALRQGNDSRAIDHLIMQVKSHSRRDVRGAAAIALGLASAKNAVPYLTKAVKKGDEPCFRGYSALALGMIGDPASAETLKHSIKTDQEPKVITQVVLALSLLKDTSAVPELVKILIESKNDTLKTFTSFGLSHMDDINVLELIHTAMTTKNLDDLTMLHCVNLVSKLLSGKKAPYLDPLAVGSNFATEYSVINDLLNFGV